MNCPNCNQPMYIETWEGWKWMCAYCAYIGRPATEEEIKELENEAIN
jgi:hypothetical protein